MAVSYLAGYVVRTRKLLERSVPAVLDEARQAAKVDRIECPCRMYRMLVRIGSAVGISRVRQTVAVDSM